MRTRIRPGLAVVATLCALGAPGCGWFNGKPATPPVPAALKDEIPPENLAAFVKAHQEGLGHMERYDYPNAIVAFRKAHDLAPGLIAGSINLAIATLNDTGTQEEKKKAKGGEVEAGKFDGAVAMLDGVIERDPDNLYARFCRGIILQYISEFEKAHADFLFVTERDPSDASAWVKLGETTTDPETGMSPRRKQAKDLIRVYTEALKRSPYNVNATYRLAMTYGIDGQRDKQAELLALFYKLDPEKDPKAPGDEGRLTYGQMGQYATVIDPFTKLPTPEAPFVAPKFAVPEPVSVALAEGDRWAKASDFTGKLAPLGRARERFGAATATFDADGDGLQDLYLAAAVVGPKGVRDALLINREGGRFEDASKRFGLPEDRASLAVAAGDFDADRNVDIFLTGLGDRRLYRNVGGKSFEDVTASLAPMGPPAISPSARWMDLDQDGDLDLFVVNYAAATDADSAFGDTPPPGLANSSYRNDGVPPMPPAYDGPTDVLAPIGVAKEDAPLEAGLSIKFTPWDTPEAKPLLGPTAAHTGVAVLDIDEDRDLDLVVSADGEPPTAILNDRLGRFHAESVKGLDKLGSLSGLLSIDLDKDGRADLVAPSASGRVAALRNAAVRRDDGTIDLAFERFPIDAKGWRSASVADLDLDGTLDLVALPSADAPPAPIFARGEPKRLAAAPLALGPVGTAPLQGMTYADIVGDALPDLVLIQDGEPPKVAANRGNGHHWLGLEIGGRWDVKPKNMRTNVQGLGVRVVLEGDGLRVPYDHTTPDSGPAQSVAPVVLGLGGLEKARLVRLKWPDGVLQCELDEDSDRLMPLIENNRKEGSCPVLFTWNGERMVCLGDFLGGGGLGYLVAPGVYGEPDRDEAVAIAPDQLKAAGGSYRMSITEPMSELAYLDKITLDVVDRPPGVSAAPDERFAPGGNRPSGKLLSWKESVEYVRATDLKGADISESLRSSDRLYGDDFKRLKGWIGYAEEHGIVLDFGDRLARFGPHDRLAIVLDGFTEYPYSQTNYAASTAGVPLKPPVLERLQEDGSWKAIEADPGYPAGMQRVTLLELTGKLGGPACTIRLRTNMEIGWDRAFVAPIAADAGLRVTPVAVGRAALSHRGYIREISPDGRLPLIYDYNYVDAAPLANLAGKLTRFGDVTPLLREDDDRSCVVGPGDEVRLEFPESGVPPLPEGWTRSYVLRTIGYCKDADPFTAGSDTVGPLPWRGMSASYPFGPEGNRPEDPAYREYLRTYQTRSVGR